MAIYILGMLTTVACFILYLRLSNSTQKREKEREGKLVSQNFRVKFLHEIMEVIN